jgi:hypothetical protein
MFDLDFSYINLYSYNFVIIRFVERQLRIYLREIVFFYVLVCVSHLHWQGLAFLVRLIYVYIG